MYAASPLQARSLFLYVTAATPAGTKGPLCTTKCTYLRIYLPIYLGLLLCTTLLHSLC